MSRWFMIPVVLVSVLNGPVSAQEPSPEWQEQLSNTLAKRKAVQVRKARTRAHKAAQAAQVARERREYEVKIAPIIAQYQNEMAMRAIEADRNQAEYLKAQAAFQQAEAIRQVAAANWYRNWVASQRRYYP